jgi:hypothetical protein
MCSHLLGHTGVLVLGCLYSPSFREGSVGTSKGTPSTHFGPFCLTSATRSRIVVYILLTLLRGEKMTEQAQEGAKQAQQAGEQAQENADQAQQAGEQAQENADQAQQAGEQAQQATE